MLHSDCVGLPPSPTYGKVSGTQFLENDVVTYSCNNGYILLGESTSTCKWDGTWNNVKSTRECTIVPEEGMLVIIYVHISIIGQLDLHITVEASVDISATKKNIMRENTQS